MRIFPAVAAITSATTLVALQGCSTQQLQAMNQQMAAVNQQLATVANPGPPMPQPTAAQQQQLMAQINQPQSQAAIQAAVQQASPNIQKVVQFMACYPDVNPQRYLGQYLAPGAMAITSFTPLSMMKYAPKTQCLNVVRLDDWQMPALNALKFRAVYNSSVSGESSSNMITFVRQTDGTWLLSSLL